jgi:iron complex transport system substrate-binding protein
MIRVKAAEPDDMNKSPNSRRAAVAVICLVVGGLFTAGCAQEAPHPPAANGKLRIVSLAPSVTEILFELGLGDSLVGATDHCDYPPEATKIQRVGGFGAPNIEMLLALNPDLVIAAGFERRELIGVLRQSDVRVLDLRIRNFRELFHSIQEIGDAVDRHKEAEAVVARMHAGLDAIAKQHVATPPRQRPKVFVEIAAQPLITAGGDSFLNDLVVRAGGVNVAHELSREYPIVSSERVIEWNPDVIIVAKMNGREGIAEKVPRRIGWGGITAAKEGRIFDDIPPDLLFRPSPRLIEGVRLLAERLHKP